MRKGLKVLLILFVLFVGVFALTGCGKKEEATKNVDTKLVGTWESSIEGLTATYEFKKDGTGSYTLTNEVAAVVKEFTFETKDGVIYLVYDGEDLTYELPYSYKVNSLIITDSFDEEVTYLRKD